MLKTIFLIVVLFVASGCSLLKIAQAPVERAGQAIDAYEQAKEVVEEVNKDRVVTLEIVFNASDKSRFLIPYEEGLNAFTILEKAGLQLEVKEYSFGKLVDSIDGFKGGQDGKYWVYYVNGKEGQTAASDAALTAGDTLEWRYQKEDGTYE